MKNVSLRLTTVAIFTLVSVIACTKDKDEDENKISGSLTATINNAAFTSTTLLEGILQRGNIVIMGYSAGYVDRVLLQIDTNVIVNSKLDFDDFEMNYEPNSYSLAVFYNSTVPISHGMATVTNNDKNKKQIEGTFSGVLYNQNDPTRKDSVVINDGKFNTTYK